MEKIERYAAGISYEDFIRNEQVIDAVERNSEKIGEAAAGTPEPIRKGHPDNRPEFLFMYIRPRT